MDPQPLDTEKTQKMPDCYTLEVLVDWPRDKLDEINPKLLEQTSPYVVGQFLERLEVDDRRMMLRRLSVEYASDVLSEMDAEDAAEVVSAMREGRAVEMLEDFEPDDAADIIGEMDDEDQERLLGKLEPEAAGDLRKLLEYEPETAGGLMTPDVDTALDTMKVDEAIEQIRGFAEKHEDLHYVYVVDAENRLQGILSLRKLIQGKPNQKISDIMVTDLKGVVHPDMDQEAVALLMAEYNLPDIAVVDDDRHFLGVITHDDIMDILQEEATEDLQILHGAGGDESVHDEIRYSVQKRNPWLQFNLVTAFIAASVVMLFEEQIGKMPLLAGFMPIIAGVGGNSGQQALAVLIRSLAMGEIGDTDGREIIFKQALIGVMNGVAIGLLAGIVAYFISMNLRLAVVVFVAMILNMLLAGFSGACIPLLLKRFNRDPAQSASIFLTAITDTGGFLIFLSLGAIYLL